MKNADVIELMLPLWKAHSPADIARIATKSLNRNITSNVIVGIAYRNRPLFPIKNKDHTNLQKTISNRIAMVKRRNRRKKLAAVKRPYHPTEPFKMPNYPVILLTSAKPHECRWPYSSGDHHFICGKQSEGKGPYCSVHRILSQK